MGKILCKQGHFLFQLRPNTIARVVDFWITRKIQVSATWHVNLAAFSYLRGHYFLAFVIIWKCFIERWILEQMGLPQRSILFCKQRKWRYLEMKLRSRENYLLKIPNLTTLSICNYRDYDERIETVSAEKYSSFSNSHSPFSPFCDKVIELISLLIARHVPKKAHWLVAPFCSAWPH